MFGEVTDVGGGVVVEEEREAGDVGAVDVELAEGGVSFDK